eukprot:gene3735-7418_t
MRIRNLLVLFVIIFDCIITLGSASGVTPAIAHPSFLPSVYRVQGNGQKFVVRQVPGDGACLFHALAVCIRYNQCRLHKDFDATMKRISDFLREVAVDVLMNGNETLVMEDGENTTSSELLKIVADHYNMTSSAYCKQMRHSRTWGGGPEIVAICNYLQRPIHVYELGVRSFLRKSFELKLCARFGTPNFNQKCPLYILCADGRFPDLKPGSQKKQGDHFLALYPLDSNNRHSNSHKDWRQNQQRISPVRAWLNRHVKTKPIVSADSNNNGHPLDWIGTIFRDTFNNNNNNNNDFNESESIMRTTTASASSRI